MSQHIQSNTFTTSQILYGTLFATGAGALCGSISAVISPLGGAIFGASYLLGNRLTHWICDKINCCPDDLISKVATVITSYWGGIAFGMGVVTLAGFSITFGNAVFLTVGMIGATMIAFSVLGCCLIASVYMTGMMLNSAERVH